MSRSLNTSIAACSSGVARSAVSLITETRYCISDHLLYFGRRSWAAAHPASAGCILRAPGRPVDLKRYALREGSRFDQVKPYVWAGGGEQPSALADDNGIDEQVELVDQVIGEQPSDEGTAAWHHQFANDL